MLDASSSRPLDVAEPELNAVDVDAAPAPSWVQNLPHSPKRRRVGDGDTGQLDRGSTLGGDAEGLSTSITTGTGTAPSRFIIPSSTPSTNTPVSHTSSRPTFLRSTIPPPEQTEPLPEAFSPHRRGQRFVPGGMAAELQSWILEAGQSAVASRRGKGYLRGEDWVGKVRVDVVEGGGDGDGTVFVEGRVAGGGWGRVMLTDGAGQDGGRAGGRGRGKGVRVGDVVGIRAPTWEVEVEGRMWSVGVDWGVIL